MSDGTSAKGTYRPPLPNDRRPLLDDADRRLLLVLQRDGRVSNAALAQEVGLAPSTVHTRVKRLVDAGVIRGFFADVDPAAVGRPLRAMIAVTLRSTARHRIRQFVESVIDLPPVIDAYFLAGGDDYLLHIAGGRHRRPAAPRRIPQRARGSGRHEHVAGVRARPRVGAAVELRGSAVGPR